MKLTSQSFKNNEKIPSEFAFAIVDPISHVALSSNRNPHLAWTEIPEGTKSFIVVCRDPDVPSCGDDVNKSAREVPASMPRVDFYHWLLFDIPVNINEIEEGTHSQAVVPRGKPGPAAINGWRHGTNDYTEWFANDDQMEGEYFGYDGPCPPWNDSIAHRYVFTVFALAIPSLKINGSLNGKNVQAALALAPILERASLTGLYSLNPNVQLV